MADPPAPKPKPGSLRDRIAAFENKGSSPAPAAAPVPRPKPGGVSWKPRPPSPSAAAADAPSADAGADAGVELPKRTGGMSASDAKESIGLGGGLKARMAALQGKGAFGGVGGPAPAPVPPSKPATEKPKWKPPPVPVVSPGEEDASPAPGLEPTDIVGGEAAPAPTSPSIEHVSEAVQPAEGETVAAEDAEEEERQRRAAIAARIARLGGARIGMAPPIYGKKTEVKKEETPALPPTSAPEAIRDETHEGSPLQPTEPSVTEQAEPASKSDDADENAVPAVADAIARASGNVAEAIIPEDDLARPALSRTSTTSALSPDAAVLSPGPQSPPTMLVNPRRAAPPRKRGAKSPIPPASESTPEVPTEVAEVPVEVATAASPAIVEGRSPDVLKDTEPTIPQSTATSEQGSSIPAAVDPVGVASSDTEPPAPATPTSPAVETKTLHAEPTSPLEHHVAEPSGQTSESGAASATQIEHDTAQDQHDDPQEHHPESQEETVTATSIPSHDDVSEVSQPNPVVTNDPDHDEHPASPAPVSPTGRTQTLPSAEVVASPTSPDSHANHATDDAPVIAEAPRTESVLEPKPDPPQDTHHEQPAVGQDEEEDEASRRKRIAERLAKAGEINPFAGPRATPSPSVSRKNTADISQDAIVDAKADEPRVDEPSMDVTGQLPTEESIPVKDVESADVVNDIYDKVPAARGTQSINNSVLGDELAEPMSPELPSHAHEEFEPRSEIAHGSAGSDMPVEDMETSKDLPPPPPPRSKSSGPHPGPPENEGEDGSTSLGLEPQTLDRDVGSSEHMNVNDMPPELLEKEAIEEEEDVDDEDTEEPPPPPPRPSHLDSSPAESVNQSSIIDEPAMEEDQEEEDEPREEELDAEEPDVEQEPLAPPPLPAGRHTSASEQVSEENSNDETNGDEAEEEEEPAAPPLPAGRRVSESQQPQALVTEPSVGSEIIDDDEGDPIDPRFHSPRSSTTPRFSPIVTPTTISTPAEAPLSAVTAPVEEDEDEQAEKARRRTIAERMAKLGGIRFGAPPPAPRPAVAWSPSEDAVAEAPEGDAPEEEEDEQARKERIRAKLAGMGGMRFGMFPGSPPPPTRPPPTESSAIVGENPVSLPQHPTPADPRSDPPSNDRPVEDNTPPAQADAEAPPPVPSRAARMTPPVPSTIHQPPAPPRPQMHTAPSTSDFVVVNEQTSESDQYEEGGEEEKEEEEEAEEEAEEEEEAPPPPPPRAAHAPPSRTAPPPPALAASATSALSESQQWELPQIPTGDFDLGDETRETSPSRWSEDSTTYPPAPPARAAPAADLVSTPRAPPAEMSADDLIAVWGRVGVMLHQAAMDLQDQSKKSVVGDGSYAGFLSAVLREIPHAAPPTGTPPAYGYLIYAQSGASVQRRVADVMPGDVIGLYDAKLKGHKGLQSYTQHVGVEEPCVGVVSEIEAKKFKIRVLQANQHVSQQAVESVSYRLEDLKSGMVKVFRVLERSV